MAHFRRSKPWERFTEADVTPEGIYLNRRQLIRAAGRAGVGMAGLMIGVGAAGCDELVDLDAPPAPANTPDPSTTGTTNNATSGGEVATFEDVHAALYPAPRNTAYTVPERPLTSVEYATTYNNYYEFTTTKSRVHTRVGDFSTRPWTVDIGGLVRYPQTIDVDTLIRVMPLEERIYRFRCVEAWAMTVPWTGFPLAALLRRVEPLAKGRFVRFVTASEPAVMPGMADSPYFPWPYFEGLRMDEAMHPLTLVTTGLYGAPLLRQNGAPLRLIVPWKYGYKSIKSIVRIEVVDRKPETFWNAFAPKEYGFYSNVDPNVPHPRWSQAEETLLETEERVPTMPYNGYGDLVAGMYR